ncbi:MAG: hypothetical protein ABGX05_16880 [Pirellulaceae bacterium]
MAQILALEWDTHEIRMLSANLRGTDVTVEKALSFPLENQDGDLVIGSDQDSETGDSDSMSLQEALAAALETQDITRANALFAVPRSSAEVRVLQVPPTPDDELPDMVRMQALRQFSTMGANWPLDFVRLESSDADGSERVLATTISPQLIGSIEAACNKHQATASRLVLRPFASGSLIQRAVGAQLPSCYMVIELLGKEADLTVMLKNQVAFMRTIRLPSEADVNVQSRAIMGELRRTIAAAQNQTQGTSIEQVVLCGDSELHQKLQTAITQDLSLDTTTVEPFKQVSLGRSLSSNLPEHPERFAALLGMLQDEADSGAHVIDFLSPRKAPEPPSNRRRNLTYAAVAATFMLLAAGAWFYQLSNLKSQIAGLKTLSASKDRAVTEAIKVGARLFEIEKFTHSQIVWLDELARLSDTSKFPGPEKAIADSLLMTSKAAGGGSLVMPLHITENASNNWGPTITPLRDSTHGIQDRGFKGDPRNRDYPWSLIQVVTILADPATQKAPGRRQRSSRSPSAQSRGRTSN